MACEKCWGDAYVCSLHDPGLTQVEHYHKLLEVRKDNPCTEEEQRGKAIDEANINGRT